LPYTPIKGIFDNDTLDYEDHGEDNTDGRIYGIVPENPNFAWEEHQDDDGETRDYACCDVYLFTGLYPEAKIIPDKSQSMEIYRKTLVGEWRISEQDNQPYYHFITGGLVGLQVLGDETEPCFEGSAFFSLYKDVKEMADYIKNFCKKKEEKVRMDKSMFRLSDSEKADALFDALNPNFNEEGNWNVEYMICDVYDDYALCKSIEKRSYARVYYTKDDTSNSVVLGDMVDVQIVDVTATEYTALEAMKAVGGSFEAAQTAYTDATAKVESLESEKTEFETKVTELETKVTELETASAEFETVKTNLENQIVEKTTEFETKVSEFETEKIRMETEISDLTNEKESLLSFKKTVETEKKEAILSKYESHLTETTISEFKNNIENFSVEEFKKEVCTAAVESDPSIFSKSEPNIYYKGGDTDIEKGESGLVRLLNKYKNGGNK
jgi:phage shock protein A